VSTKTGVDRVIENLKQKQCRFPVSRADLREKYHVTNDETIGELARRGLLVESELWDGSLPQSVSIRFYLWFNFFAPPRLCFEKCSRLSFAVHRCRR
jgi:hypothetical protein